MYRSRIKAVNRTHVCTAATYLFSQCLVASCWGPRNSAARIFLSLRLLWWDAFLSSPWSHYCGKHRSSLFHVSRIFSNLFWLKTQSSVKFRYHSRSKQWLTSPRPLSSYPPFLLTSYLHLVYSSSQIQNQEWLIRTRSCGSCWSSSVLTFNRYISGVPLPQPHPWSMVAMPVAIALQVCKSFDFV